MSKKVNKHKLVNDGWSNILTNLGKSSKDKRLGMEASETVLAQTELETIYQTDDMCAKIIDTIPQDMTREGFKLVVEGNKEVSSEFENIFERHDLDRKIEKGLIWSRLYGGAGAVMGIKDGKRPDEPVDMNNIKDIEYIVMLDRFRLKPVSGTDNIDLNVASKNFGKPVFYNLQDANIKVAGESFVKIHHSRVIRFEGIQLGYNQMSRFDYWGDSVLSRLYNVITNFQGAHDSAALIMTDFTQMIIKLKNLADMIAQGDDDLVQTRLALMSATASIVNAVVIEDGEEAERKTTNVSGLPEMLKIINDRLVAATDYPHTVLLGEGATGGLGTQGQSEKRDYYDRVKNKQESSLRPILRQFCDFFFLSKSGPSNGKLQDYSIEFNPLWQPSQKEIVETRKLQSEIDEKYINSGVLDPEEVTKSRFMKDQYSFETEVDSAVRKQIDLKPEEDDKEK